MREFLVVLYRIVKDIPSKRSLPTNTIIEMTTKYIKKDSYKDLESLLADGGKLIDVRSEEEYKKFHLDGAVNLPYDDSHNIMRKSNPGKDQNFIVYCSAGKRSVQARNLLVYLGYKNVYLLTEHEGLFDK